MVHYFRPQDFQFAIYMLGQLVIRALKTIPPTSFERELRTKMKCHVTTHINHFHPPSRGKETRGLKFGLQTVLFLSFRIIIETPLQCVMHNASLWRPLAFRTLAVNSDLQRILNLSCSFSVVGQNIITTSMPTDWHLLSKFNFKFFLSQWERHNRTSFWLINVLSIISLTVWIFLALKPELLRLP